jgi:hypothetical protein
MGHKLSTELYPRRLNPRISERSTSQARHSLPHFSSDETQFVVRHIEELALLVRVAWVGPGLRELVDTLTGIYSSAPSGAVALLAWSPGDVVREPEAG